mgnify:CR=1 FL=1
MEIKGEKIRLNIGDICWLRQVWFATLSANGWTEIKSKSNQPRA